MNGWLQYVHPEHAYRDAQENVEVPGVNGSNERPYKIANAVSDGWEMLEDPSSAATMKADFSVEPVVARAFRPAVATRAGP